MLNRYIEFLKKLSESVFEIKGLGSLSDYFEAVWRGFLLLFLVVLTIVGLVAIVVGPVILWSKVWKKISKKVVEEINALLDTGKAENSTKIWQLQNKLKHMKVAYVSGLSILHLPFIIPLILMLLDFIF